MQATSVDWSSYRFGFERPTPPTHNDDALEFQLVGNPVYRDEWSAETRQRRLYVYFFGVTASGGAVRLRAYGKKPNMLSTAPVWLLEQLGTHTARGGQAGSYDDPLEVLRTQLNGLLGTDALYKSSAPHIERITITQMKPFCFYQPDAVPMCFYELQRPGDVVALRKLLLGSPVMGYFDDGSQHAMLPSVYDCNVDFTWRTMIDQHLQMCYWVRIPAGAYQVVTRQQGSLSLPRPPESLPRPPSPPPQPRRPQPVRTSFRSALPSLTTATAAVHDAFSGPSALEALFGVDEEADESHHHHHAPQHAASAADSLLLCTLFDEPEDGDGDDHTDDTQPPQQQQRKRAFTNGGESTASKQSKLEADDDTLSWVIECPVDVMEPLPIEGAYAGHAPQRIMSADIECAGRLGIFPQPDRDPVICICSSVHVMGDAERLGEAEIRRCLDEGLSRKDRVHMKVIDKRALEASANEGHALAFYWRDIDVSKLPTNRSVTALEFADERQMLLGFARFIRWLRPEWVLSWNGHQFDFPYLIHRAQTLGIADEFCKTGVAKQEWRIREATFKNSAGGHRAGCDIEYPGVTFFDCLQVDLRESQRREYTLGAVAKEELGVGKEDVHHSEITPLFNDGGAEGRARLISYCLQDEFITWRIAFKRQWVPSCIEMSRVTSVSPHLLQVRGTTCKAKMMIMRACATHGYALDYSAYVDDDGDENDEQHMTERDTVMLDKATFKSHAAKRKEKRSKRKQQKKPDDKKANYSGALVIEPQRGFYLLILVVDFQSLYPTVMVAFNLCYSTQLRPEQVAQFTPEQVTITPKGEAFLKREVHEGLLPKIERELMAKRQVTKREMAAAEANGEFTRAASLNNRQNNEKLAANGLYGVTGSKYWMANIAVAEGTTSIGQEMIKLARANALHVLREVGTPFGTFPNAEVPYGDTDSLMINLGAEIDMDMGTALKFGQWLAPKLSEPYPAPIKLLFEKIYSPYLLLTAKRYAGLFWTQPETYDKVEMKGLETKRRDNCPWMCAAVDNCLRSLLIERQVAKARDYVCQQIEALLLQKVPLEQLTITTKYAKLEGDYKNQKSKPIHLAVNKEIREREGDGAAFHPGDRIPFCVCPGLPNMKKNERARYVKYVEQDNGYVDVLWYVRALGKALVRILDPLFGLNYTNKNILNGPHMLKRKHAVDDSGPLGQWLERRKRAPSLQSLKPVSAPDDDDDDDDDDSDDDADDDVDYDEAVPAYS